MGSEKESVQVKIERAFLRLIKEDALLLENDVNERSLTHHLARYLGDELPEWHVDCEYNRSGDLPKRLVGLISHRRSDDTEGTTVFPDIIVHRRGTTDNYIVIEAKKRGGRANEENATRDIEKLGAYKKELAYKHAYFLHLPVGSALRDFHSRSLEDYIKSIPDEA